MPKVLLPHQKSTLDSRIANIDELITDEAAALEKEKETTIRTSRANKARIEELSDKLAELRQQVKPDTGRRERDDFGRMPRDNKMDEDAPEPAKDREGDAEQEREREWEREREDKERGVQIKGEDGDVEVEY